MPRREPRIALALASLALSLLLLGTAVAAREPEDRSSNLSWTYEDLVTLDAFSSVRCANPLCGWGEDGTDGQTIPAALDIVAIYARGSRGGGLDLRIDLLDAADPPPGDLVIALGTRKCPPRRPCRSPNLFVRWSGDRAYARRGWFSRRSVEHRYDPRLDTLEVFLPAELFPRGYEPAAHLPNGPSETPLRIQVASVQGRSIVDEATSTDPIRGQATLVLNMGNALTSLGPGAEGGYVSAGVSDDFRDLCDPDAPPVPGGSKYLLDAVSKYEVPVVLPDVQMEMLPGLEYLGITERLGNLARRGLIGLPDNLSFGYFMPWQHQAVDARAIEMAAELRRDLIGLPCESGPQEGCEEPHGARPRVFFPAEAMLRVEDLRTLAEMGYRGLMAGEYYGEWFDEHVEKYAEGSGELRTRLEDERKVQDVTVTVGGRDPVSMKVFFLPESGGIDTDERWGDNDWNFCAQDPECAACDDLHWATFSGTDGGLHLLWRRALLDYAVAEDQHRLFQINADILLTPMMLKGVAARNLRWIAAHPWVRGVTLSGVLERIQRGEDGWLRQRSEDRQAETDFLPHYPLCGEDEDYNTYFRYLYDGEKSPGLRWSCLVPCDRPIEGFAPYRPFVSPRVRGPSRMGGYCPEGCGAGKGPGCGDDGCQDTLVHKTVSALLRAPQDNPLTFLAWMHYFVVIEGQTAYVHDPSASRATSSGCTNGLPNGDSCSYSCSEFDPHELGGTRLHDRSKVFANFMGNVNKLIRAAHWADRLENPWSVEGSATIRSDEEVVAIDSSYVVDSVTRAFREDLDFDGEDEFVLQNGDVFAVFENDGGRLQYAFLYDETTGPIQVVGALSQHFGLIQANVCCPDRENECDDELSVCYGNGESPLHGEEYGGAFAEVLYSTPETPLHNLPFSGEVSSEGRGIVFSYPVGCESDCQIRKQFVLKGTSLEAEYTTNVDPGFDLEFFFGLPVDMASMYRPGSRERIEEIGEDPEGESFAKPPLGWKLEDRAQARVVWDPQVVGFGSRAVSFAKPVEEGEPNLKYPYNTVLLRGPYGETRPEQFVLTLELEALSPPRR